MYRGLILLALAVGAEAFAFGPSAAFPAKTTASLRRASHVSGRAVAPLGLRMAGDKAEIDFGKVGFDQESQVGQTLTVTQCTHSRLRCAVTRRLGPIAGPAAQPSSPPPSAHPFPPFGPPTTGICACPRLTGQNRVLHVTPPKVGCGALHHMHMMPIHHLDLAAPRQHMIPVINDPPRIFLLLEVQSKRHCHQVFPARKAADALHPKNTADWHGVPP